MGILKYVVDQVINKGGHAGKINWNDLDRTLEDIRVKAKKRSQVEIADAEDDWMYLGACKAAHGDPALKQHK
eukprot:2043785-Pyramimonas_sp.AAC.1